MGKREKGRGRDRKGKEEKGKRKGKERKGRGRKRERGENWRREGGEKKLSKALPKISTLGIFVISSTYPGAPPGASFRLME